MNTGEDFKKFANSLGINSMTMHDVISKAIVPSVEASMTPYILEERPMNITQMDVFSRLMKERTIFFGTGVDDQVANIITAQLLYLESQSSQDIMMYVNSPGGSVYAGLAIKDTMDYIESDVATTVVGMAASMGAIIQSSGEKGKRFALPSSRIMIHQPLGGAQGQASDIEITAQQILILKQELYEILSENTGKTFEEVEKNSDRDYWMRAEEALKYGMIDEIIKKKK